MIVVKAFRTFTGIYSLLKTERLGSNTKLALDTALIRPVTTYACPAWELAADAYLFKLQRLRATETLQGAHWAEVCTRLSIFRIYLHISGSKPFSGP
jgi:hypothetical protein